MKIEWLVHTLSNSCKHRGLPIDHRRFCSICWKWTSTSLRKKVLACDTLCVRCPWQCAQSFELELWVGGRREVEGIQYLYRAIPNISWGHETFLVNCMRCSTASYNVIQNKIHQISSARNYVLTSATSLFWWVWMYAGELLWLEGSGLLICALRIVTSSFLQTMRQRFCKTVTA